MAGNRVGSKVVPIARVRLRNTDFLLLMHRKHIIHSSLFPDGKGGLVIRHYDFHGPLLIVEDDLKDFGRGKAVADKFGGVIGPGD